MRKNNQLKKLDFFKKAEIEFKIRFFKNVNIKKEVNPDHFYFCLINKIS